MKVAYGIQTWPSPLLIAVNKMGLGRTLRCRFWWLSIIQGDGEEKSVTGNEAEKQWNGAWVLTSVEGMKY